VPHCSRSLRRVGTTSADSKRFTPLRYPNPKRNLSPSHIHPHWTPLLQRIMPMAAPSLLLPFFTRMPIIIVILRRALSARRRIPCRPTLLPAPQGIFSPRIYPMISTICHPERSRREREANPSAQSKGSLQSLQTPRCQGSSTHPHQLIFRRVCSGTVRNWFVSMRIGEKAIAGYRNK